MTRKRKAPNGGFEKKVKELLTRIYLVYPKAKLLLCIRDDIHEHTYYPWNVRKSSLRKLHNALPSERSEHIKINDAVEQIVPAYVRSVSELAWYLYKPAMLGIYNDIYEENITEDELYYRFRTNLEIDVWYDTFRQADDKCPEDVGELTLLYERFFKEPEDIIVPEDIWKLRTLKGSKGELAVKIIDDTEMRVKEAIRIRKNFIPGKRDIEKAVRELGGEYKVNFAPISSLGDLAQKILDL